MNYIITYTYDPMSGVLFVKHNGDISSDPHVFNNLDDAQQAADKFRKTAKNKGVHIDILPLVYQR